MLKETVFENIELNTINYEQLIQNIKKYNPKDGAEFIYTIWYVLSSPNKRLYSKDTWKIMNILDELHQQFKNLRRTPSELMISTAIYIKYKKDKNLT
jgi:hypothetical protein